MPFLDILRELVEGVGAGSAATIMGTDGIPVQDYPVDDSSGELEGIGVEYGAAIEEIKKASGILGLGELDEVVVATGGADVLFKMLTPEYYMVMKVARPWSVGKARYLARRAASRAARELQP